MGESSAEQLADSANRHTMKFTILLMCFLNVALLVTSSPVPQHPHHHLQHPHQRRPQTAFSFLEDIFQRTLGAFNSTFGFSQPQNKRQSNLSYNEYEGNNLPTDNNILDGLIALRNYRKGINSATTAN